MGLPISNKNENNHGGGNIIEKFLGKWNRFFKNIYCLFILFLIYIFFAFIKNINIINNINIY